MTFISKHWIIKINYGVRPDNSPQLDSDFLPNLWPNITYWPHLIDCLLTVFFSLYVSLFKTLLQPAYQVEVLPAKQDTAQLHYEVGLLLTYSLPTELISPSPHFKWLFDFIMIEHTVICFVLDLYMHWWHHHYEALGSKMSRTVLFLIHSAWQRAIHFVNGQKVITEFFTTSIIPIYKNKTHIIMYIILI